MGERGDLRPLHVQLLPAPALAGAVAQPHGRHSHHSAAALAVVDGVLHAAPFPRAQRGQARSPRRAAGVELWNVHQPGQAVLPSYTASLRQQPVLVHLTHVAAGRARDPPRHPPRLPQQDPVGGEQGHLGVVGDQSKARLHVRLVLLNAPGAVAGLDARPGEKLHRIAQRVSRRAAQQAAPDLVPVGLPLLLALLQKQPVLLGQLRRLAFL